MERTFYTINRTLHQPIVPNWSANVTHYLYGPVKRPEAVST